MIDRNTHRKEGVVWSAEFNSYHETLLPLLESAGLTDELASHRTVLIKPNLVEDLEPPITTHVDLVEALVDYILHHHPDIQIIVGEGTGALEYDTFHCSDRSGLWRGGCPPGDRTQLSPDFRN